LRFFIFYYSRPAVNKELYLTLVIFATIRDDIIKNLCIHLHFFFTKNELSGIIDIENGDVCPQAKFILEGFYGKETIALGRYRLIGGIIRPWNYRV
jgi:hypothetical protein